MVDVVVPTNEATPGLESGFTQLANELLEAMCRAGFSARQWAVVMTVVRKTYGYGKKADDISLGQIVEMTGIAKPHASRTVNDLVAANVLKRSVGTFGYRLSINKRYQQWALEKSAARVTDSVTQGLPIQEPRLPKEQPPVRVTETATPVTDSVTGEGVTDSVMGVTDPVTGYRFGHAEVTDSVTTKEHSTKERKPLSGNPDEAPKTDDANEVAKAVIQHLNDQTGSNFRAVESNLKLIRGRVGEGYSQDEIRAVVDMKCREWGSDPRMRNYLRPATLFNATNFAQYAGMLGQSSIDGRVDLGGGRYRINNRTYRADGSLEPSV